MKAAFWLSRIMLVSVALAPPVSPARWVARNPMQSVTVDYLYEACSSTGETAGGKIPYFDCASYVHGVLDSYRSVRAYIPKSQRACIPDDMAPWKILEDFEYLLDENGAENAAKALFDAFPEKYPCK